MLMCTRNLFFFYLTAKTRTVTKAETYVITSIEYSFWGTAAQADIPVGDNRFEILQLNQSSVTINHINT